MKTPILETKRVVLRPLSVEDAQDIYDRWTSDDRVSKYVRWCTHSSVEDTKGWLQMIQGSIDSDKAYDWGFYLKDENYLFGSGGIFFNQGENCFEVGYNIMHKYWNQGYTTEIVKAILEFATNELGITEFVAWHAKDNPASGAVLKKCGFIYEKDDVATKFDGVTTLESKGYRLKL